MGGARMLRTSPVTRVARSAQPERHDPRRRRGRVKLGREQELRDALGDVAAETVVVQVGLGHGDAGVP